MSFGERLNLTINTINCSNAALSKTSGIDASLISRLRNGKRIPSENSKILKQLFIGLLNCANDTNRIEELKESCHIKKTTSYKNLYKQLYIYITDNGNFLKPERHVKNTSNSKKASISKQTFLIDFSTKLNDLMNITGTSNIKLAKFLNIDASLISRFRNGLRVPNCDSELIYNICRYFSMRSKSDSEALSLISVMDLPMDLEIINNSDLFYNELINWLQSTNSSKRINVLDEFLEILDNYSENVELSTPDTSYNSFSSKNGEFTLVESYWGTKDMTELGVRFLQAANTSKEKTTMYIYSDQKIGWITNNHEFEFKWSVLLHTFLRNGNKIVIIHNMNKNPHDILEYINTWLPFYTTGSIEPYYCKKDCSNRFTHTLLFVPNIIAVVSSSVYDVINDAEYRCYTDKRHLDYYANQYKSLLKSSCPLLQAYTTPTLFEFNKRLTEYAKKPGHAKMVTATLTINTMPRSLLNKILFRNNLSKNDKKMIIAYYEDRQKRYLNNYSDLGATEICLLPDNNKLYAGKVSLDIPSFVCDKHITYTPAEYSEHIANIIQMLITHKKYMFVPIYESTFENLQLGIKDNTEALVVKYSSPCMAFYLNHPILCSALNEYTDLIIKKNKNINFENAKTSKELLRYLK